MSRSPVQSRRRRGASMVEVLFAIFMALLGALILAATLPTATTARVKADYNNRAMSLAQKQIEAIRGMGYPNLTPTQLFALGLIDSTTPVGPDTYSFTNIDHSRYDSPAHLLPQGRGTVRLRQLAIDLREVVVEVSWVDKGQTHSLRVGTRIANL